MSKPDPLAYNSENTNNKKKKETKYRILPENNTKKRTNASILTFSIAYKSSQFSLNNPHVKKLNKYRQEWV